MFSEQGSSAQMPNVGRRVLDSSFHSVPTGLLLKCPSMAFSISLLIQQPFNYYVSPSPESFEPSWAHNVLWLTLSFLIGLSSLSFPSLLFPCPPPRERGLAGFVLGLISSGISITWLFPRGFQSYCGCDPTTIDMFSHPESCSCGVPCWLIQIRPHLGQLRVFQECVGC